MRGGRDRGRETQPGKGQRSVCVSGGVLLVSISFISALIFIISFLLVILGMAEDEMVGWHH